VHPNRLICIDLDHANQRLDNFISNLYKGVPKSRIQRAIREGDIRVNGKKQAQNYRIQQKDEIKFPQFDNTTIQTPKRVANLSHLPPLAKHLIPSILYEDDSLLVLNKPSGLAVHGGSGLSFGVIELIRQKRPEIHFLELVHRIDRDTSGLLLLAKKRSALTELHASFRNHQVRKTYLAIVHGVCQNKSFDIKSPLHKYLLSNGERRVHVDFDIGLPSESYVQYVSQIVNEEKSISLLKVYPKTGRTHQIRVHLANAELPILFDDKYGNKDLDKRISFTIENNQPETKRLMLHAWKIQFNLKDKNFLFEAPPPSHMKQTLLTPLFSPLLKETE
jgi:23S rRNA pseudouridine955/2504/2580 synthase